MNLTEAACPRCEAKIPADAQYCPQCGVSIVSAATGEYDAYDLDRFFNCALDLLCIAGVDGYFKLVNPAFERTLGYPAKELLARPFADFVHPDDQAGTATEVGRLASGKPTLSFDNRYRCKDGTYKHLHWTSFPEPGTGLLYAIARDVTDVKQQEQAIDRLTGLASRQTFDSRLLLEWNRAVRLGTRLSLTLVDVDRFLDFTYGTDADTGDRFICQVVDILKLHGRRAGDLVARYSRHEFAVLTGGQDPEDVTATMNRVRAAVESLGVTRADSNELVTVSAGTATVIPVRDRSPEELVASAKMALIDAARQGGNRVVEAPTLDS